MPRQNRRSSLLATAGAVIVLLLVVLPQSSAAQRTPALEMGSPSHSADGTIVASLRASDEAAGSLAVLVDGDAVPFAVTSDGSATSGRVVFVVENSVSMTAGQLAELQVQMRELAGSLGPADQIGIVTFGGGASVSLPLTTDRGAFEAAVNAIEIGGGSALFSGIATATDVLSDDGSPALIVVATYGWDWGGLSSHSREVSVEAVLSSNAHLYVQSLVFDGSVDTTYLSSVASDGLIHGASQLASLADARSLLSGSSSALTLTVTSPPLALGAHELRVTSEAGDDQRATFEVTNSGLLSLDLTAGAEAGDPIGGRISSVAGLDGLELSVSLTNAPLAVASDGSFSIDPWAFEDGARSLVVTASVGGRIASELTRQMTIPVLTPLIGVEQNDDGNIVATVQSQPTSAGELVAVVDSTVIARSETPVLELERPDADVTFELRAGDGTLLASETLLNGSEPSTAVTAPSTGASESAGSSIWTSPAVLGGLLGLAAVALALMLRRRRAEPAFDGEPVRAVEDDPELDDHNELEPIPLLARVDASHEVHPVAPEAGALPPTPIRTPDWTVVVRTSDGQLARFDVGYEPVSIGASKLCTVTLDDDQLRFVHLVIACEGPSLTAHQFGPVRVDGKERNIEDEQVLTNSVMEIGDVSIWLEGIVQEPADAI